MSIGGCQRSIDSARADSVFLLLFALIVVALWGIGLAIPRYDPIVPVVVVPFPSDPTAWTGLSEAVTLAEGGIRYRGGERGLVRAYFRIPFRRPSEGARLRIEATVREGQALPGGLGTSALSVRFERPSGEQVRFSSAHIAPSRHRVTHLSRVVGWRAGADIARVGLVSQNNGPAYALENARVVLVEPSPIYRFAAKTLAGCAGMSVLAFIVSIWRRGALLPVLAISAVVVLVIYCATASIENFKDVTSWLAHQGFERFGLSPHTTVTAVLKGSHAVGFSVLAFCAYRASPALQVSRSHITVFIVLLAFATEGLQTHLSDRGGSLVDVAIDLAGVLPIWWVMRRKL